MNPTWHPLITVVEQSTSVLRDAPVDAITEEIRNRYGESIAAVLFYGSCMRSKNYFDGLLDLYVVVDGYHSAYQNIFLTMINVLLPPNVFNLEIPFNDHKVRAKYAVISKKDFQKATSRKWFHSYIWGRFTQPIKVVYMRDNRSCDMVVNALANAVRTFLYHVIPECPNEFESEQLWETGFQLTYQAELRAEKQDSILTLYESNKNYFDSILENSVKALPFKVEIRKANNGVVYKTNIGPIRKLSSHFCWKIRIYQGKVLSVLRILKALFTFEHGVEYVVSKLEKHSGQKIELTEKVKRHPLVYGWGYFLKLYIRKVYK